MLAPFEFSNVERGWTFALLALHGEMGSNCDERADTMDAEGEVERGVDASELGVLYEYDAIGTIACEAEEEGEQGAGEQWVKDADDSSNGGRRGRGGHGWRTVVGVWVFFSGPAVLRSLL